MKTGIMTFFMTDMSNLVYLYQTDAYLAAVRPIDLQDHAPPGCKSAFPAYAEPNNPNQPKYLNV